MGYGYGAGVRRGLRSQGGKSGTSSKSNLKEELEKTSPADKEGRTWKELIVLATLKLAMKGNAAALREVCASSDINKDGVVNVLDVQLAVNAVLGLGCRSGT